MMRKKDKSVVIFKGDGIFVRTYVYEERNSDSDSLQALFVFD